MDLLGISKKEAWKKLSDEIGGDYIYGGFWRGDRVELKHKNWTIYLDTYTVSSGRSSTTYTRVRAPYITNNSLYFKIYKKGFFSNLGNLFGMQNILIDDESFNNDYIIKGNYERDIIKLLSNSKIKSLIKDQPKFNLEIKKGEGIFGPAFPETERELYFLVSGVIKNIELLKKLFELFIEILEELESTSSIKSNCPNVKLY